MRGLKTKISHPQRQDETSLTISKTMSLIRNKMVYKMRPPQLPMPIIGKLTDYRKVTI